MRKYVNIVGMRHYEGIDSIRIDDVVTLKPCKTNPYDAECVEVFNSADTKIGAIANSLETNLLGCSSAGNLCDIIKSSIQGRILFIDRHVETAIAEIYL